MKKIRICGVGSVLLGDDAVGPYTARWIAANYEFGEDVEVEDLGTPGLDLIAYMTGIDVLILIDSVENREPAGTVTVYDKAAITRQRPAVRLDPHSPCITESIFMAELAGDGPEDDLSHRSHRRADGSRSPTQRFGAGGDPAHGCKGVGTRCPQRRQLPQARNRAGCPDLVGGSSKQRGGLERFTCLLRIHG